MTNLDLTTSDPLEFLRHAQVVQHRVDRLCAEAERSAHNPARLVAIVAEMEVCLRGLEEIREAQLVAELERNRPRPRRRWWRRRSR